VPATAHAIPAAQGSVLAQLHRDGSPFGSSGQAAGRKPRRSRALLACQQDTDQACRSQPGPHVGSRAARMRSARKAAIARPLQFRPCGVRQEAHRRALNRLKRLQRSERTGTVVPGAPIDRVNRQDAEPRTGAEHQRPPWHLRWYAVNRHHQAPRRPCMAAGATNGVAVHLLGYRQRMRSQLSPSRPGFQANGMQRPRRSKARAPAPVRGQAVPAATRPDPTPGRIRGTPRPCRGLRPGRPAVSTLPRRRVGRNRRRVR
jgi:hypothetical protein